MDDVLAPQLSGATLKLNIFTKVVGDVLSSAPSLTERTMLMSTYEEFMIILTTASLIVAILNMKNKKQSSCALVKLGRLLS